MPAPTSIQRAAAVGYSYRQLATLVQFALQADAAVLVRGHPGVGKSALAHEVAARLGLPVLDLRLAQKDPAELAGIYAPNADRTALQLLPPDWALELSQRPMLLFLDEINAAVTKLHQAAAYQMVLERRVGPLRFHPETRVLAAGNLDDDRALAMPLSSALNNRFVHFRLKVDPTDWLVWAEREGLHQGIRSYIRSFGGRASTILYKYTGEDAFATPRSWAAAARLLAVAPAGAAAQLLSACVGPTAAEQYQAWQRVASKADPRALLEGARLPDFKTGELAEPSLKLAMLYAVAELLAKEPSLPPQWLERTSALLQAPGIDADLIVLMMRKLPDEVRRQLEQLPSFAPVVERLVEVRIAALESSDG